MLRGWGLGGGEAAAARGLDPISLSFFKNRGHEVLLFCKFESLGNGRQGLGL